MPCSRATIWRTMPHTQPVCSRLLAADPRTLLFDRDGWLQSTRQFRCLLRIRGVDRLGTGVSLEAALARLRSADGGAHGRAPRSRTCARSVALVVNLSTIAGLSPSRFAHVFTESMGTPLRPFMRWLRLRRAARELVSGRSATHAAHVAGFADAAHLTRTFRRMLGGTPRILIRRADSDSANAGEENRVQARSQR